MEGPELLDLLALLARQAPKVTQEFRVPLGQVEPQVLLVLLEKLGLLEQLVLVGRRGFRVSYFVLFFLTTTANFRE